MIGAIYDDRVCTWDVYAIFYDCGCNKNIILVIDEVEHDPLHLLFVQLTVSDRQSGLRNQSLNKSRNSLNCFNSIVNKEHLAAARQFKFNRRLDNAVRKLHHLSLNFETIAWRSLNQRHIAHSS